MRLFDLDHWREIASALAASPLRTLLTALGVFWGIFLLMVMLGSGKGLENAVVNDFSDGATNCFFMWSRSTSKAHDGLPAGRWFNFDNDDTAAIRARVPEAAIIAPRNQLGGYQGGNNVVRGEQAGAFSVMGDYPEIRAMEAAIVTRGRFLNDRDLAERRKVAVIGRRVHEILFEPDEEPIGDRIRINGVYFMVVGVFDSDDAGDRGDRDTQTIFIPFTTFQRAFNYGDRVGWYAITAQDDVPASVVEDKVRALLAKRHRVHPEDTRAIGSFNLEEEYLKFKGLFFGIRLLIWVVGIGTLAAGVIGVSNIMLVIVRERTKEIGVRRALGATPWAIVVQVVLEAVVLTSIAGWFGMFLGVFLIDVLNANLPAADAFRNPSVELKNAWTALGIVIASGVLAGLMPAQRAVSVRPVEALRAE